MAKFHGMGRGSWLAWAVVVMLLPGLVFAAERQRKLKAGEYNPADETVEMFQAMRAGDIAVKLIPKDSTEARVLIENKTKRPLNVKLPDAFAGVPVLAQIGGLDPAGGLGARGGRDRGTGGAAQPMGGGMMGGMGGMGMGMGGMMNVAPEKVGNLKVATVCLAHGKPEPRPKIPYEIKPIDEFTDNVEIHAICRMVGTGEVNQRAAQAAAWHYTDGMSWQELAAKQLRSANGTSRPYFSPDEIKVGMRIAETATRVAEELKKQRSEKSDSLSRP
ncbi:MAG TPA: hypothetical protein DD670_00495 [Planctomycetaceae bacterium]|nr:hypothetical protein [Planctomycetaceae bacterium]